MPDAVQLLARGLTERDAYGIAFILGVVLVAGFVLWVTGGRR